MLDKDFPGFDFEIISDDEHSPTENSPPLIPFSMDLFSAPDTSGLGSATRHEDLLPDSSESSGALASSSSIAAPCGETARVELQPVPHLPPVLPVAPSVAAEVPPPAPKVSSVCPVALPFSTVTAYAVCERTSSGTVGVIDAPSYAVSSIGNGHFAPAPSALYAVGTCAPTPYCFCVGGSS
eukprot:TRINITY_DN31959_c0_g1_i1.p1 TRINITY_DN31959_c0_g1~~TRINITY_DN31959_c0_g1_i1.p1  ORF type:complete len:206 (+),score=33.52 TRINITY_DN31959_c0_g1_i1:77-619(+)